MWRITGRYGPYHWSRTSQAFYQVLSSFVRQGESVLEFGSSSGHISFRMARDGHRVTLLDIRPEAIEDAREKFGKAGVSGRFVVGNFLEYAEQHDLLWNSGLLQCLSEQERERLLVHAAQLSKRLFLFYPDTDSQGKVLGVDPGKTPGVDGALEHSVATLPERFCRHYRRVYSGRLPGAGLGLGFDMLWLQGDNACG